MTLTTPLPEGREFQSRFQMMEPVFAFASMKRGDGEP